MSQSVSPPVMGWSSWNHFRQNINETVILESAQAMHKSGLAAAGYQYVNLDDCWQSSDRDEQGNLQFDLSNFPHGRQMIDQIHDLDLKVGLYSSCGPLTCEDMPASYGHEKRDAVTFTKLGIDFLKYDYCHVVDLTTDEKLLNDAPDIIAVTLFNTVTDETLNLPLGTAALTGAVQRAVQADGTLAISGLANAAGQLTFDTAGIAPGQYVLTVVYRKTHSQNRKLLVADTGDNEYVLHFPRSSGWSASGRVQVLITLTAGTKYIQLHNPIRDRRTDAILRYRTMANALNQAQASSQRETPFVYSVCEHGRNRPWEWAPAFAGAYRIHEDIRNNWDSVRDCYEKLLSVRALATEGSYADPDMLEVGNGALTPAENMTHFTLWAFLSAPLVLGNDIRDQTGDWLPVVTNEKVIAVNQSAPFLPADLIDLDADNDQVDVLAKYLSNGRAALCFFNKSDFPEEYTFAWEQLPDTIHDIAYAYTDQTITPLWPDQKYLIQDGQITMTLPAHGVSAFQLEK
ncbi:alpha-galactosidase [Schleiferilactobacillus perolens]|nr:alpha-galactosidase [Schleiferilactobacillus perolens]